MTGNAESDRESPQCCVCDEPATHQDATPPNEYTCDDHAISVTAKPIKGDTIPKEQYEHIEKAMMHLGRIDDRELPADVASYVEITYGKFDDLASRVDHDR